MKYFIGCDLGGTNLRAALIDVDSGECLHAESIPTLAREGHDAVMARMAALMLDVIRAAGMTPGQIGGVGDAAVSIGECGGVCACAQGVLRIGRGRGASPRHATPPPREESIVKTCKVAVERRPTRRRTERPRRAG